MMQHALKFRSPNGRRFDHGIGVAQLPNDQPNQTHSEESRQRLDTPKWVAQPVPLLSLAEHHFPTDHDDDQQRQPDRVKIERPLPQFHALGYEVVPDHGAGYNIRRMPGGQRER
jgi:hypothetical protein